MRSEIDPLSLERMLTIWPIVSCFASYISAGDLINLSRCSSNLRASLHGDYVYGKNYRRPPTTDGSTLRPRPGQHQTHCWKHLKSLTSFACSSSVHTKGTNVHGCVFCSLPICEACIVKDSFKNKKENTFRNRLRYLCIDCWNDGVPIRSSRSYSAEAHEAKFDVFCECTLKDNGWLCLECKREQNVSATFNGPGAETSSHESTCYGFNCSNYIGSEYSDRDRRRVCLWCEKALKRQYTGEERYAWNSRLVARRNINAESRARDIREYNLKRLHELRMSRREMRGTNGGNVDDKPEFVRHLDTINYRNFMPEASCPSPNAVYQSKKGVWKYDRDFLLQIDRRIRRQKQIPVDARSKLQLDTGIGALPLARTNEQVREQFGFPKLEDDASSYSLEGKRLKWNQLRVQALNIWRETQLIDDGDDEEQNLAYVVFLLRSQYGFRVSVHETAHQFHKWSCDLSVPLDDLFMATLRSSILGYLSKQHDKTKAESGTKDQSQGDSQGEDKDKDQTAQKNGEPEEDSKIAQDDNDKATTSSPSNAAVLATTAIAPPDLTALAPPTQNSSANLEHSDNFQNNLSLLDTDLDNDFGPDVDPDLHMDDGELSDDLMFMVEQHYQAELLEAASTDKRL